MSIGWSREFVAFDLETTGLRAEVDRVVEIGAVRFDADGRELGRFERLVDPGRPMPPAARAVHGISDADLAGAATVGAVLPEFFAFVGAPGTAALLAHNAWFDAGFLGREIGRLGWATPDIAVTDTLALARRRRPDLSNHRLDTLARALDLDPEGPHRALADSLRVMGVWLALRGADEPADALVSYPVFDARRPVNGPVGWDAIHEAITRGWRVRMEYTGGTRGALPREISPRAVVQRGGTAYLVAFCHLDEQEKSFRLDRVRHYEVVT